MADDHDGYVGGILNMSGVRPGEALAYAGPTMRDQVYFTVSFTSTHDAIARLFIPPPLKVDRDKPPVVQAMFFINRHPSHRSIAVQQLAAKFRLGKIDQLASLTGEHR